MSARVAFLAVRSDRPERAQLRSARPDHDLPDSVNRVGGAVGPLGREALVVVVVADEDQLGAVLVERLPERTDEEQVGLAGVIARREQRVVPVRQRAGRFAPGELGAQPPLLV
jgi:hypothetical protein